MALELLVSSASSTGVMANCVGFNYLGSGLGFFFFSFFFFLVCFVSTVCVNIRN